MSDIFCHIVYKLTHTRARAHIYTYTFVYMKTFRVNLCICLGSNAGPCDQSTMNSKEGTPANDVSMSNNSSQGPKGQREHRSRPPRMQQSNKPKEALVNGTSG